MNLQVYAESVNVEHEANDLNVYLQGVDSSLVLAQFSTEDLIEHLRANDFAALVEAVATGNDDE